VSLIQSSLEGDKADDLVVIDLHGRSSIADYLVIASAQSARHVGAMAEHLALKLKGAGAGRASVEGMPQGDWVLIDAGDVIVHLFRPEIRGIYNLEKMWGSGLAEPERPAVMA
jgi:ribosome-associated protein